MKKLNLIIVCMALFVGISLGQTKVEPTTEKAELVEGIQIKKINATPTQNIEAKEYDGKSINVTPIVKSTETLKLKDVDVSNVEKSEIQQKKGCVHAEKKKCSKVEKKKCSKAEQKKCSHALNTNDVKSTEDVKKSSE